MENQAKNEMILAPGLLALLRWMSLAAVIFIAPVHGHDLPLEKLNLPAGFQLSVYAEVINPRQLARSPSGIVFSGSQRAGNVYALIDEDRDNIAETVVTIDSDLSLPSGIAYRNGDLYVGSINRILVYRDIVNHLADPPAPEVLYDSLPEDRHHGWKYLDFGPDGNLYFNVGAPCNICLKDNPWYASIMRMDLSKTPLQPEVFAHGIRNSVGFTWHPETKDLWFTDNGRDYLGDDLPPCELNRADKIGMHFGYPYRHGKQIEDPEFGPGPDPDNYQPPALELGAHVAPLGLTHYEGPMFPREFSHRLLIAEHGSWNRSPEAGHTGYRISMAVEGSDGELSYQTFIDGWLQDNLGWGRPVDLLALPDGSLLISDDTGNVIYRVTYAP